MKCRLSGIKEISVMNYKDTLNMMKTDFPMRASLPQREPEILKNGMSMISTNSLWR